MTLHTARLLALVALGTASPRAHAWPYTPWTGATGQGVLGINPYVEVADGEVFLNPWLLVGLHDRVDVIAGATAGHRLDGAVASPSRVDGLARLAFSDTLILAATGGFELGGPGDVGLEVHGTWERDRWLFVHNTGVDVVPTTGELTLGSVLAPDLVLGPRAWTFLEVHPAVTWLDGGVSGSLDLVPGITAALDPEADHLLTLAVPIGLSEPSVGIGACWWGSFDLIGR